MYQAGSPGRAGPRRGHQVRSSAPWTRPSRRWPTAWWRDQGGPEVPFPVAGVRGRSATASRRASRSAWTRGHRSPRRRWGGWGHGSAAGIRGSTTGTPAAAAGGHGGGARDVTVHVTMQHVTGSVMTDNDLVKTVQRVFNKRGSNNWQERAGACRGGRYDGRRPRPRRPGYPGRPSSRCLPGRTSSGRTVPSSRCGPETRASRGRRRRSPRRAASRRASCSTPCGRSTRPSTAVPRSAPWSSSPRTS